MSAHAWMQAQTFMELGRYPDAARILTDALTQDPHDATLLALLSQCESEMGNKADAMGHARQAMAADPENEIARFRLGAELLDAKKPKETEKLAREGLDLDPESEDLLYLLGIALFNQRRYKESLNSILQALEINPEHNGALAMRTQCKTLLRHKDATESSLEHLRHDSAGIAMQSHALMLLRTGQTKQAYEAFREALREDPHDEDMRDGLKEAIRGRFPLYRWLLIYWTWVSGLGKYGWIVVIGIIAARRILIEISKDNPTLRAFLIPVIVAMVFLIWGGIVLTPMLNALLLVHPYGKYAMVSSEKWSARYWLVSLVALLVAAGLAVAGASEPAVGLAVFGGVLWVMQGLACMMTSEKNKLILVHALGVLVIGGAGIVLALVLTAPPLGT